MIQERSNWRTHRLSVTAGELVGSQSHESFSLPLGSWFPWAFPHDATIYSPLLNVGKKQKKFILSRTSRCFFFLQSQNFQLLNAIVLCHVWVFIFLQNKRAERTFSRCLRLCNFYSGLSLAYYTLLLLLLLLLPLLLSLSLWHKSFLFQGFLSFRISRFGASCKSDRGKETPTDVLKPFASFVKTSQDWEEVVTKSRKA